MTKNAVVNHTPGPWIVCAPRHEGMPYEIRQSCGEFIATVFEHSGLRVEERIPNAHLIAAAPDLLESCERLLWKSKDYLNGLKEYPETESPEYVQQLDGYVKQAQAAIKKARGK